MESAIAQNQITFSTELLPPPPPPPPPHTFPFLECGGREKDAFQKNRKCLVVFARSQGDIAREKRRKGEEYYKKLVCLREGRFGRPKTESGEFSSRSVERGESKTLTFLIHNSDRRRKDSPPPPPPPPPSHWGSPKTNEPLMKCGRRCG